MLTEFRFECKIHSTNVGYNEKLNLTLNFKFKITNRKCSHDFEIYLSRQFITETKNDCQLQNLSPFVKYF